MRQAESRRVDALRIVEQQVEVEGARRVAVIAAAPETCFQRLQHVEQGFRGEGGFNSADGVDEIRLAFDADRCRAVKRRAAQQAHLRQFIQCEQRGAELRLRLVQIGTEGDVGQGDGVGGR